MKIFLRALLIISLFLSLPAFVRAAGIEVSPSKLEVNLTSSKTTTEIVVVNPTPDVQVFDVFADDFPDNIKSDPTSFTLEAGGRKKLILNIRDSGLPKDSKLTTFISVVATPLAEGRLQARTGVKIPLLLNVQTTSWYKKIPLWAFAVLGLLIVSGTSFVLGSKMKQKTS